MPDIRSLTCMLKRDRADVSFCIDIKHRVFIEIPGLGDLIRSQLNE